MPKFADSTKTAPVRPNEPTQKAPVRGVGEPARLLSAELFGSHDEIHIEHNAVTYRLRKTALGKLILTK